MSRQLARLAVTIGTIGTVSQPLSAQQKGSPAPTTAPQRVEVCKLVLKEEVKKHLPWIAALDQMPIDEEPIGTSGSSCNYPTVHVQVLPFTQGFVDAARRSGPLETIPGVGDEAYFRNNRNQYAELFVRIGPRLLTLQADADDGMDTVKPRVIELAKVYVPKLR